MRSDDPGERGESEKQKQNKTNNNVLTPFKIVHNY